MTRLTPEISNEPICGWVELRLPAHSLIYHPKAAATALSNKATTLASEKRATRV